ncbi:ABC superfamily ATP binding cassette transporter, ABC protein [Bifidobacterium angulatum]|nr:ABC superfamily ATP binding cassette transporter, ABC protein [Bifidobacterium angulatum]
MKKSMLSIKQSYLVCAVGIVVLFGILMGVCETGAVSLYVKGVIMTCCIAVIMTTSLNLTIGVLGQLTLGCCGFEAIGAYSAALVSKLLVANGVVMNDTVRFLLVTVVGGLVACVFGVLIGIPALRLHGDYLAIITLGFGEIIRVIIQNLKVAGGEGLDKGQQGQALIGIDRLANLYVVFWITVVTVVLLFMFARSRYGRAVKAIRDDEIAASASGINVTYMKVLVFAISAFFAGIAGGIFAQYIGALTPSMAGWLQSINYVIMVVFGGMGSLTGSIVSAIGLTILPELLRAFSDYRMLVYSVVLVLIMIFRPQASSATGSSRCLRRSTASSTRRGRVAALARQARAKQPIPRRPSMSEPILRAEHLGITFGGLKAVSDFNMTIDKGELVGLIGPNGAGKTTVFNLLTGVYQPTEGEFFLDGKRMNGKKTYQVVRAGIARTFQNIRLFKQMTVEENVLVAFNESFTYKMGGAIFRTPRFWKQENDMHAKAIDLLRIFNLEGLANTEAANLPYGAQRKLEIARALATGMKLLLLDEPAAGMNPTETEDLLNCINTIRDRFGIAILLIEHDMSLVMNVCQRIQVLDYGRTIASGLPEEVANNPQVVSAYLGADDDTESEEGN